MTHLEHRSEHVRYEQMQEILQLVSGMQPHCCLSSISDWQSTPTDHDAHLLLGDLNTLDRSDYAEAQWKNIIDYRIAKGWTDGK